MGISKDKLEYSVVIPVYNEEENAELLYNRIVEALESMKSPYEIIFIDDGSSDKTFQVLSDLKKNDDNLKVIKFRGNFGQSAAMGAGFRYASGKIVIAMDGDLQNDPMDIPNLIKKINEGYDIVSGWRKNRKDKMIIRKIPSKIANRLVQKLTGVEIHDTGCSLKAYRKEILNKIRVYGELHRFIPALGGIEGARISEVEVTHHARKFGVSKYNITRTFRVIMDLISLNVFMKYLSNPLQFFGRLGFVFNGLGLAFWGVMLYCQLFLNFTFEEANVLLSTTFLFFSAGFQILLFGLIANMVVRTSNRIKE